MSLKRAIETIRAEPDGARKTCDGKALERYYAGRPFSDKDWQRITGNYVEQNGDFFMVYCHEKGGYVVDAFESKMRGDGMRIFCTDESHSMGCGREWDGSRHKCMPCPK